MKEKIEISLSREQIEDLCKNYIMNNTKLNISREDIKLDNTVIEDNRVNEWENAYSIERLDFTIE